MKIVYISAIALLSFFFRANAQPVVSDSSSYKLRKLKVEEINLVSSYYRQDGIHSAITGGIGTEKLTDIANTIDITLVRYPKPGKKHILTAEAGIDHYTSASSDKIDLSANSSASSADNRFYPSVTYTIENELKGHSFGGGLSSSTEYDYQSFGGNVIYSKKTKDKNGEFSSRLQAYIDQVRIIKPVELRNTGNNQGSEARNSYSIALSYSQIINKNLQVIFLADLIYQDGYLGLPFHRVYFNNGSVHHELLPASRIRIPVAIRASYFLGDYIILRGYYRYYQDDWDLKAHTLDFETPVKITNFFSVSPFYRFYSQSPVKYFAGFGLHTDKENFYTSNYDLSKFNSSFAGIGLKITPLKGVFGMKHFHTLEVRYGHYLKSTDMVADIISLNIKYK